MHSAQNAVNVQLTAWHEAAHAIVAWRLGVPVRILSIKPLDDLGLDGFCVCDWQSLRRSIDDETLCTYGFSIAYAGIALEMLVTGEEFQTVYARLPTDQEAAREARRTLCEWTGLLESETRDISVKGFNPAAELVSNNLNLIKALGARLASVKLMEETGVCDWLLQYATES